MKNYLLLISGVIFIVLFSLFLIRLISPREIDDVSPGIFCDEKYLAKADILWVIPDFDNNSISDGKKWCKYILAPNKTIQLHGVTHEFEEFKTSRNQDYLNNGIKIFEDCFGFKPEMFKPPQLKISGENKKLISQSNLKLKGRFNQIIHKVYHCNDSGMLPNWFINIF
jgi:predicted deacetylase